MGAKSFEEDWNQARKKKGKPDKPKGGESSFEEDWKRARGGKSDDKGGGGFFDKVKRNVGNVAGMAAALPEAVVGAAKRAPGEIVDLVRIGGGTDVNTRGGPLGIRPAQTVGDAPRSAARGTSRIANDPERYVTPEEGETPIEAAEREFPLSVGTIESVRRTRHNLTNPTEYARAWDEGTLGLKVFEDTANLTALLRGGAKVPGAGKALAGETAVRRGTRMGPALDDARRLGDEATEGRHFVSGETGPATEVFTDPAVQRAADATGRATKAADVLGRTESAMMRGARLGADEGQIAGIIAAPLKGANKALVQPAVRAIAATETGAKALDSARETVGKVKEFLEARRAVRDLTDEASDELTTRAEPWRRAAMILPKDADQVALVLAMRQADKVFAPVLALAPDQADRVLTGVFGKDSGVNHATLSRAADINDEALPKGEQGRFAEARGIIERGAQEPRTAEFLAGRGKKNPLSPEGMELLPEQLGTEPTTIGVLSKMKAGEKHRRRRKGLTGLSDRELERRYKSATKTRRRLEDVLDALSTRPVAKGATSPLERAARTLERSVIRYEQAIRGVSGAEKAVGDHARGTLFANPATNPKAKAARAALESDIRSYRQAVRRQLLEGIAQDTQFLNENVLGGEHPMWLGSADRPTREALNNPNIVPDEAHELYAALRSAGLSHNRARAFFAKTGGMQMDDWLRTVENGLAGDAGGVVGQARAASDLIDEVTGLVASIENRKALLGTRGGGFIGAGIAYDDLRLVGSDDVHAGLFLVGTPEDAAARVRAAVDEATAPFSAEEAAQVEYRLAQVRERRSAADNEFFDERPVGLAHPDVNASRLGDVTETGHVIGERYRAPATGVTFVVLDELPGGRVRVYQEPSGRFEGRVVEHATEATTAVPLGREVTTATGDASTPTPFGVDDLTDDDWANVLHPQDQAALDMVGAGSDFTWREAVEKRLAGEDVLAPPAEDVAAALADDALDQAYGRVLAAVVLDNETPGKPRPGRASLSPEERVLYDSVDFEAKVVAAREGVDQARQVVAQRLGVRARQQGRVEQRLEQAVKAEQDAATAIVRINNERLETLARAIDDPDTAPARYSDLVRASLSARAWLHAEADLLDKANPGTGRKLREAAADLPVTLSQAVANGVDPAFLPGGLRAKRNAGLMGLSPLNPDSLPRVRTLRSEHHRTGIEQEHTFEGLALRDREELHRILQNEAAVEVRARFARQPGSVLDPADFDVPLSELTGPELAAAMSEAGYTAWNPAVLTETVAPAAQRLTTEYLPNAIFNAMKSTTNVNAHGPIGTFWRRGYDGTTRSWKVLVLALRPAWLVNNVIGNALMATIGGGVTPVDWLRHHGEVMRLLRAEARAELDGRLPRRLLQGPTAGELEFFGARVRQPHRLNVVARAANRSFRMNSFVDSYARSITYLAKLDKGMDEKAALRAALKAAGDFNRMSAFERNVIRRIFPFYAWLRHITKLTFSLPIEHPARVVWTLHLADLYGDPEAQAELPGFLRGSIPLGGDRFLTVGAMNPFGDSTSDSPILSARGFLSSINPALAVPFEAATGIDLRKGQTATPGRQAFDALDGPELLSLLLSQVPQTRVLNAARDELTGNETLARRPTGQPYTLDGETIPEDRALATQLARFFGLPLVPVEVDLEEQRRRDEESKRRSDAGKGIGW